MHDRRSRPSRMFFRASKPDLRRLSLPVFLPGLPFGRKKEGDFLAAETPKEMPGP